MGTFLTSFKGTFSKSRDKRGWGIVSPRISRYPAAMNTEYGLVTTTFSDPELGRRLAEGLLEKRLAACVQTLPIHSTYRWKGAVQQEAETLMLIKTKVSLYPEVEAHIRAIHSYAVPEIVLVPIAAGFAGYLQWIADETK
jgi:periplasmic divalent cation tolerance protein